ncbi:hypothetical protein AXL1_53 [Stenotrophomonas phage vB_SmaS-AXL_1]|uniref:hypothetical protein n=1 Tax=Stenotrophomonas phage vB_SmaS-AXL_1 TaxID=2909581 RepID=UPI002408F6E6|nr:hypothetical protein P9A52_gp53 [Stenotrophomonas phage vB_SmaS-AXL_1]UIS24803.1 hypothetical protein AXL1_53 [Stenotrophomonas phage vB_SmaS-AXL_1]
MCELDEGGDDLRAARGIALAVGLSILFWSLVVGSVVLARGCHGVPSGHSRPAAALEAA